MSDKRIVNSIRGDKVDFDKLRLQINDIPESDAVKHRENLIQGRRKRKNSTKRKVREMFHQQQVNEANMRKALDKQKAASAVRVETTVTKGLDVESENVEDLLKLEPESISQEAEKFNRKIKGK